MLKMDDNEDHFMNNCSACLGQNRGSCLCNGPQLLQPLRSPLSLMVLWRCCFCCNGDGDFLCFFFGGFVSCMSSRIVELVDGGGGGAAVQQEESTQLQWLQE